MDYFPFFFDLRGKLVLLVGGGEVALRKAALLVRAGAKLRVVAPRILPELAQYAISGGGTIFQRSYRPSDISDCKIVVSAADTAVVNERVAAAARRLGVPVNVVDTPALCDFIFPAVIDRSPLIAAVSSSGVSPVLARQWRSKIEALMPTHLGRLAVFCNRFRKLVKSVLPVPQRRLFWEAVLEGTEADAVLSGDAAGAESLLRRRLCNFGKPNGEVYLIGAGCGEAELLTFQALRLLQRADVVFYDRLVAKSVLELARRDAEKIYVGKQRDCHAASQEEINALLIEYARRGLRVARLKGGDPFIFGRGGEEREALVDAGIHVQVASGITAAIGVAAAVGIPLTHRKMSRGVRFCTAYREDMDALRYWKKLADDTDSTLVFYMAGINLQAVADRLINAGRCPNTPAAVICAGATAAERVISAPLVTIADRAKGRIYSPALIIVGEVVRLCQPTARSEPLSLDFPFFTMKGADDNAIFAATANR